MYSAAWLQQKGKNEDQCIREYIALFALCDPPYAQIVDQIVTGKIKNIKIEDTSNKAGGIMSKSVPRPKAEDPSQYIQSLN